VKSRSYYKIRTICAEIHPQFINGFHKSSNLRPCARTFAAIEDNFYYTIYNLVYGKLI
jgi:hypothetical protein